MSRMIVALALAAFASAPIVAAEEKTANSAERPEDADKLVCKAIREVNSRIPKRVCHTKAEWVSITARAEDLMRDSKRGASSCVSLCRN